MGVEPVLVITPNPAPAGSVIALEVVAPEGFGIKRMIRASLEAQRGNGWEEVFLLAVTLDPDRVHDPVPSGTPGVGVSLIGLDGPGPDYVRLPDVAPGRYRICRMVDLVDPAAEPRDSDDPMITLCTELAIE